MTHPTNRLPHIRSSVRITAIAIIFFAFLLTPTQATWYREHIEDGADIIMMDLRWPFWPSGSYFANWNSSFNPKPNNISFYAGFTSFLADGENQMPNPDENQQEAFRPGSVWTFWGSDDRGTPVRFLDVAPNLYIKNDYGGEGSSGTTGATVWPFVERNQWYTMVARVWQPEDSSNALVGRWMKDHRSGEWHLIGIAQLPIQAKSFTGNSGFLEPLTSEKAVRSLHRRFGYYRKDGTWRSSDTISIDKTEYVVANTKPEGDHEYIALEYAQRPDNLPLKLSGKPLDGSKSHSLTAKQPRQPMLDRPAFENLRAVVAGNALAVSWDVPSRSTPPLSFHIEVFEDPECKGNPIAQQAVVIPSARHAIVSYRGDPLAVRVRMTDIFDQSSDAAIAPIAMAKIAACAPLSTPTTPGLRYELWTKDEKRRLHYFNPPLQQPDEQHAWIHLDEWATGKKVREGISRGFDTSIREDRDHGFAIKYTGYLDIPADGPYILSAQIDGAFRILLDGQSALEWDGQHGTTEKAASVLLAQGSHPIEVDYLVDQLPAMNFAICLEGAGRPKHPIRIEQLRTPTSEAAPKLELVSKLHQDGTATIRVSKDEGTLRVRELQLYLDRWLLAKGENSQVQYTGPFPRGESTIWARALLEDGQTFDTQAQTLLNDGPEVALPWRYDNVGDLKSSAGVWQTGPDGFSFFGSGMHTLTQRVSGDFVAECNVTKYNGQKGEPVNRRAWVGLTAREHGQRRNWEWGRDFHLVQTAADGLRSSADFTDFGAGRISSYELPKNHPWLRIARQGDLWTAWSSPDGTDWKLGAVQYKKMAKELDVGLFFSALPQDARAHYFASVSSVAIDTDSANLPALPVVQTASDTHGDRWTGVVVAPSDPRTVIVRSNHQGLMISRDGGGSWTSINGKLSEEDLCVRSVAIDPVDSKILYRASGKGPAGKLWKSIDGGSSWVQLAFEGDFDGQGPSALCGEVIAIDIRNRERLFVGCESKGFFKSEDGGKTFTYLSCQSERITSVVVWPWEKYYPAPARGKTHLCVTTCSDVLMEHLGRGKPRIVTEAKASKSYITRDDAKTIVVSEQRDDCGFYNVAFDKAMQSTNEMRYATSHGYQTQVFEGWHMALYPSEKNLEWFRPYTAVGAAAQGDAKFGRFITGSLVPQRAGRYSVSERWAFEFSWIEPKPIGDDPLPTGGLIAVASDPTEGKQWYFLHTDGLYYSGDSGATLKKVLENR